MRLEEWLAADSARGAAEEHRALGSDWTLENPDERWRVAWVPATGELYCVAPDDVVQVLGRFPDERELRSALRDHLAAHDLSGSLYGLRAAAANVAQPEPTIEDPAARQLGARYIVDADPHSWWELGWDRPLNTFYAQRFLDAPGAEDPVESHGNCFGEVPDTGELAARLGRELPPEVANELDHDRTAFPHLRRPLFELEDTSPMDAPDPLEAWLRADPRRTGLRLESDQWWADPTGELHRVGWVEGTGELYDVGPSGAVDVVGIVDDVASLQRVLQGCQAAEPGHPSLSDLRQVTRIIELISEARDLDALAAPSIPDLVHTDAMTVTEEGLGERARFLSTWERDLQRRERAVAANLQANQIAVPAWSLPAGPVAAALRAVQEGTGDDLTMVARGFDVDPDWAEAVVEGRVVEVDIPRVQQLCEALHCSPYDLWGKDDAQRILHAYGPELWPRFIEPLAAQDPVFPDDPSGPDLSL
jgi:hypothetical protein